MCHQSDFERAAQPIHVGVIGESCGDCHGNDKWSPARGSDHSFPLQAAHASAACSACHVGQPPVYEGTPSTCLDCHEGKRDEVLEPSHLEFSDDCGSCHSAVAWAPATIDHAWPLEGAHALTTCGSCHGGEPRVYAGTPATCLGCHEADRAQVTLPSHQGFSEDCATCHGTASWNGASFEHTSRFPLTGVHQQTECMACHVDTFAGTASDCVACHRADFDASPFSGHAAFATTCQDCHATSGWVPASGGHPQDRFSITGTHDYACNDCHNQGLGPNGAGNSDCVGCHTGTHSLAKMDGKHSEGVRGYPSGPERAPNFCLDCHSDGR